MQYKTSYTSPLGTITLISDGIHLTHLFIEGQKHSIAVSCISKKDDLPIFKETKDWLDRYFQKQNPISKIKLKVEGTFFQKQVWEELQQIPYGKITTYKEIAMRIAKKLGRNNMSCQAVGHAIGLNPISILIPCHRVLGTNHTLTGYNGGIKKKEQLLKIEGINLDK